MGNNYIYCMAQPTFLRQKMETKPTTLLKITDKPNTTLTGTRQNALFTALTTNNALR